ncbi:MAG: hypothetical protein ACKVT1_14600 [Dehalococcoidia bacterium]
MKAFAAQPPATELESAWAGLLDELLSGAAAAQPAMRPAAEREPARALFGDVDPEGRFAILRRQRLVREAEAAPIRSGHPSRSYGRLNNRQSATWLPTLRVS